MLELCVSVTENAAAASRSLRFQPLATVSRGYDSPDNSVDPDTSRQDDIFQFDAVNTIPLTESWSVIQQVQYLLDDSNLRNYSYDNLTVAMSARWRF